MAENPCWDGYEQIGMKMKNGKKVPNCVPVKRAKTLSTPEEQTQKIKSDALAMVKQANSEFSGTRTITYKSAMTVVDRSLAKNSEEPFSVRKHRALTELSHYITLAQHNRSLTSTPENTDLLPIAHPRSTRAHDLTTASLLHFRARWVTDDPAIKDATVKTLIASALTSHPASAEYEYAVARLESYPAGQVPAYALLAALGDGNSSAARRARAMRQRRDRKGRFAEMGGGLRALIRRLNGVIQNLNGRAVSQGIETDTFDFETPDGKLYRVPAGNVEAIKAVIPSQQTKDGYAKNPAKVSAKDPVLNEADLVEIEAPEGFRFDPSWGPDPEEQKYYGVEVDLGKKYTDDAYDVIKMENNQAAKDKFEAADQREREGQNVVAQGDGANGELDPEKPVFLVNRRGQEDNRPFAVVQSWAEVQDFIGQDEPRFEKNEEPNPDRMGDGNDDGTPPEEPKAQLPEDGDKKFPEGTEFVRGNPDASRRELREFRKNMERFRKEGGLVPLDPRKNWAILPDGSIVDADSGELLRNDKREVFPPKEEEKKGIAARIKEALAPKGAYDVDRGDYKPEGPIDGQESPDFTDDPAELAQKYSQEELQESLKDAVEGTPEQPAPGYGQLPFEQGDEIVPAEALYNALKEQGVDIDKFLNDIYEQMAGKKKKQEVAPVDQETKDAQGVDVPEAPVAEDAKAEIPPLIEGMTAEEQRDFIDNGDYKKYLKPNEELDIPEGYAALDNEPFNEELVQVPADAPEGFNMNPVDIALGYEKDELKSELRRAVEPGNNMPGHGILGQETPEGEIYQAYVPGEAIRDALQLQGEDTNALLNDIYAEGKDNKPTDQEVADAIEGENVQEEPAEPEKSPAQDAQGPDADSAKAGLPADNEAGRVQGVEEAPEGAADGGVERLGSQEADLAMGEPRREMVAAKDLQAGDIAVRDNEYFVIEEVDAPAELSERGQKDKGRNRINVRGYYPGHQTQERDWFADGKIEVIRGVAAPAKGDGEPLNKPKLEDYVGGPKEMKKIDGEWGAKDPAVQEKYAADLAAHKAAVQAAGADFVDPTVADKPIAASDKPAEGPFVVNLPAGNLEVGDIAVRDHFRIVEIKPGEKGKIAVIGHYPGQGLQEKQWWPNNNVDVIRGVAEADAPQQGEGSLHRPAGRGPKGGWYPIDDPALNAEHQARIDEAKARWKAPENLPVVAAEDVINPGNKLDENPAPPERPRTPAYPAFMGKFAEWAKEAQGNWAAFKEKLKGQELIVFDFETTGFQAKDGNEPIQIAAVKMVDGKIVDRFNIFMNPGRSIKNTYADGNAKDIDGNPLTDEWLAQQPNQAEALQKFLDWAGPNPLAIAQNAAFDDEIMKRKAEELGLNWEPAGMADTMGMAAAIFKDAPDAPDRKRLDDIAQYFGINNENWHDGANDAEVTAQAFNALIEKGIEGNFGVDALDADARQAEFDAKMEKVAPKLEEYKKARADYLANVALRQGLAGNPVNIDELAKEVPANGVVEGPIDNIGAMNNPEPVEDIRPDLVSVAIDSAFPDGKMRIADAEFANDFNNVDQIFRGGIKAEQVRPGDFMRPKKDDDGEFFQVVSVRGGEEYGLEEWKRRFVLQNAQGERRVAVMNANAFIDEVRRPKDRKALAGEPLPQPERTPEEMNMQAVTVAAGNAVLEINPDGQDFVAKGRLLDNEGNEIYAFEARFATPEGAEAEGKALLRRAGADRAEQQRRNDGNARPKSPSVAIGVEPADVDQIPVVEFVDDLPVGQGQNDIIPEVKEDAVVFKSEAKVVDDGEVIAQVVEEFPSQKAASQGGRDNIDAMAEAIAEQIREQRDGLLLRTEGRGRRNLPPIPNKYRRQVYLRMLAGLYADANGNPLAVGDRVRHNNENMHKKWGEGVVIGKVQGKVGGLQRKGVVYVDYALIRYDDGRVEKRSVRLMRHLDSNVAKQRFDAEPRINWMNKEELDMAIAERNKKPRKGGNAEVDAADVEVDEVVQNINDAVAPAQPAAPEAPAAEAPAQPEAPAEPELDVAQQFQLLGNMFVENQAKPMDKLKVADLQLNDFIEVRNGGRFGRVIELRPEADAKGRDGIAIKVEFQNGNQYEYKAYRKELELNGVRRIDGVQAPQQPAAPQAENAPAAPATPQQDGDRANPVPRMAPIDYEPKPDSGLSEKLRLQAQAKKDLAAFVREIGPQNKADYRTANFIKAVQGLQRHVKAGDDYRAALELDAAKRRARRYFDGEQLDRYQQLLTQFEVLVDKDKAQNKFRPQRADFAGAPLEEFDPIALREKRIQDGENKAEMDAFWQNQILRDDYLDDLARERIDVRKYKDDIRKFFAGDAKPLAELDDRARFALEALVNRQIAKPSKTTEEKANMKNMVELAAALHAERHAYEPDDGLKLDARGAMLLDFDIKDIQKAHKGDGFLRGKNGENLGFFVKKTGTDGEGHGGGGRQSQNETYFVYDQTTGKVYIFKKDTNKKNIDSEMAALEVARALGMHGIYPAERHPKLDNVVVMGYAGQNVKMRGVPNLFGEEFRSPERIVQNAPVKQLFDLMILDAAMHNNDRHGANWLVGKADDRGMVLENQQYLPLLIDNGLAGVLVPGERNRQNPVDYIKNRSQYEVRNAEVHAELLRALGPKAFYEMMQISTQQALQALRRKYPVGTNPDIDTLVKRIEMLKNADLTDWE